MCSCRIHFLVLLLIQCYLKSYGLINCNEPVDYLQLCTLDPAYVSGSTDKAFNNGTKLQIDPLIVLKSIGEFDHDHNTITMDVTFSTTWNDTRLTIKSSNSNE